MSVENTVRLRKFFSKCTNEVNLRGILGVTQYYPVYDGLMQIQKKRLKEIVGIKHEELIKSGFIISIAYAYPNGIIDNIGLKKEGVFDKESWNIYAKWYETLNRSLNKTSNRLAEIVNGIAIPATSEGMAAIVKTVQNYYPTVVSHRVHAEHSGIGWRGKNCLIVNPVYSCMIRLAGVITSEQLVTTSSIDDGCKSCDGCLQVCTFLDHREKLDDYRQQCLNYMNWLDLYEEVCGKCIKACIHSDKFTIKREPIASTKLDEVLYTLPSSGI